MYTLRFDGLFRQIPGGKQSATKAGFMCYGWLIFKNGVLIARGHGAFVHPSEATSNVAEYLALIEGLEALTDLRARREPVLVIGDAKSVIDQMTGEAQVNSPAVRALYRRAKKLAREFSRLGWFWSPREFNREADRLTRRAMSQLRFSRHEYDAAIQSVQQNRRASSKGLSALVPLVDFRIYQPAI